MLNFHTLSKRQSQLDDDEINLMDLLLVLAKHNRFILKLTGSGRCWPWPKPHASANSSGGQGLGPRAKVQPKRSLIVILATLMAFFLSVLLAFFREASERASQDPASAERMSLLRRFYAVVPKCR